MLPDLSEVVRSEAVAMQFDMLLLVSNGPLWAVCEAFWEVQTEPMAVKLAVRVDIQADSGSLVFEAVRFKLGSLV